MPSDDQKGNQAVRLCGTFKVAIAFGPKCPHCGCDGFDDWWLAKSLKPGVGLVALAGRLACHDCGKFFSVTRYHDGEVHSTARSRAT